MAATWRIERRRTSSHFTVSVSRRLPPLVAPTLGWEQQLQVFPHLHPGVPLCKQGDPWGKVFTFCNAPPIFQAPWLSAHPSNPTSTLVHPPAWSFARSAQFRLISVNTSHPRPPFPPPTHPPSTIKAKKERLHDWRRGGGGRRKKTEEGEIRGGRAVFDVQSKTAYVVTPA